MIDQACLLCSAKELMQSLLDLADNLRQYRISCRGGPLPADSIDALETEDKLPYNLTVETVQEEEQTNFLSRYRQQLIACLDQSIASEIQQRYECLQRRQSTKAKSQVFLQVLKRYYCDHEPMTTIAAEVGFKSLSENY